MSIGFLLSLVGLCSHEHYRRERDARGYLWLQCEGCARRVPALDRTSAERRQMVKRFPAPPPASARKGPAEVISIATRKGGR